MSKRSEKKRNNKPNKNWISAKTADIEDLYIKSVQCAEAEIDLINQVWKELRSKKPTLLREDFSGSGAVSQEWIKQSNENTSWCVDLDKRVLSWGKKQAEKELTPEQISRIFWRTEDVRFVQKEKVDTVLAMNFSYFLFKTREELKEYFVSVYKNLKDGGLFLLDAYGGADSHREMEEERDLDGFTYVWDQSVYDPITSNVVNHIHFRFPDGSSLDKAFTYDWRLWSLQEIKEILKESGFEKVVFYWEGTDEESEEGNGEWHQATVGEACDAWVAYIVALKK